MANCSSCGKKFGFFEDSIDHEGKFFCPVCFEPKKAEAELKAQHHEERKTEKLLEIDAIMLTTETAPNLNIKSRVGIIMADADCAFDVAMVKNKDALLSNLKSEAHTIGANAVVGVTFNMIETYSASIGIGKVNTFKLLAYGTAVIIETEEGAL